MRVVLLILSEAHTELFTREMTLLIFASNDGGGQGVGGGRTETKLDEFNTAEWGNQYSTILSTDV